MAETKAGVLALHDVQVGKTYIIKRVAGTGPVRKRIMDMGITKGTRIYVRKVAPLGDPVQISLRGYELSFRKEDASLIEVEEVESDQVK